MNSIAAIRLFLGPLSVATLLLFFSFALVSWREKEPRAAGIAALCGLTGFLVLGAGFVLPTSVGLGLIVALGLTFGTCLILFLLPMGRGVDLSRETPTTRFDERDIMFARARLKPESQEFASYYALRPENLAPDNLTRSKPGLLSLQAQLANPLLFASPQASFCLTEALSPIVDGPVQAQRWSLPPDQMTTYIKSLAHYYGALQVGIAVLKPYYVYSHIGRGEGEYGAPIQLEHRYAIAFTVEMDYDMVGANPAAPGVMESALQYVEAARVAVQLAAAIRCLGYPARAHIDGNYRVIAPLVARDAGLGEIGRMGILLTPGQGARVRLGVVTTDLELVTDRPTRDASVIDFCTICNKCAENCPVKAIPFGDRQEIDGALRWRINPDTCFRYWNVIGTDCGRCMTVCPYSHPQNFYHDLVRWGISRSGAFRHLAVWLDNLFYGKRPAPRQAPGWTDVEAC